LMKRFTSGERCLNGTSHDTKTCYLGLVRQQKTYPKKKA
jgi:hypothetical protein